MNLWLVIIRIELAALETPAGRFALLSHHFDRAHINKSEFLELLDEAPLPVRVNAPGGAC